MGQTADAKDTPTMTTMLLQKKYGCYKQAFIFFSLNTTMRKLNQRQLSAGTISKCISPECNLLTS
jgi:hypothetical protein